MTAKEKSIEIYNQFKKQIEFNCQPSTVNGVVKQCAIIHVKDIIKELENLIAECRALGMWSYCDYRAHLDKIQHWQQVLTELNQM